MDDRVSTMTTTVPHGEADDKEISTIFNYSFENTMHICFDNSLRLRSIAYASSTCSYFESAS